MEYDRTTFKVRTWKHWTRIHWIINPLFAIIELVFGQRVPKIVLLDKTSDNPIMNGQFVPCPHCGKLNDGRLWSKNNTFKNWFGYYCPNCGKIIPCIWNITSWLIIVLTSPIWVWFVKIWKRNWLRKQPVRFENIQLDTIAIKEVSWLKMAFNFGGPLFLIMTFILPLIEGKPITLRMVLIGIPLWTLGGLVYGYTMKYWFRRIMKPVKKINKQTIKGGTAKEGLSEI